MHGDAIVVEPDTADATQVRIYPADAEWRGFLVDMAEWERFKRDVKLGIYDD
jgi:hypothetical protein